MKRGTGRAQTREYALSNLPKRIAQVRCSENTRQNRRPRKEQQAPLKLIRLSTIRRCCPRLGFRRRDQETTCVRHPVALNSRPQHRTGWCVSGTPPPPPRAASHSNFPGVLFRWLCSSEVSSQEFASAVHPGSPPGTKPPVIRSGANRDRRSP